MGPKKGIPMVTPSKTPLLPGFLKILVKACPGAVGLVTSPIAWPSLGKSTFVRIVDYYADFFVFFFRIKGDHSPDFYQNASS
jgi:hypothetical protein